MLVAVVIWVGRLARRRSSSRGSAPAFRQRDLDARAAAPAGARRLGDAGRADRAARRPERRRSRVLAHRPGAAGRACYTAVRRVPAGAPCPLEATRRAWTRSSNTIGDTIGGFFANPIVQFALQASRSTSSSCGSRPRTGPSATCSSGARTRSSRTSRPRSSSCSRPVLFVFGVIVYRDRPAAREDRRGLRAQPRRGGAARRGRDDQDLPVVLAGASTTNGSSAPPAARGSTACAPTAAASSASTGRCAPGAARTSSAPTSPSYEPIAHRDARSRSMPRRRPRRPRPAAAAASRRPCAREPRDDAPRRPAAVAQNPAAPRARTRSLERPDPRAARRARRRRARPRPTARAGLTAARRRPPRTTSRACRRSASRAARVPALYLIGWVGSVMGLAVLLVSFLARARAPAARWLFLAGLVVLGLGLIAAAGLPGDRAQPPDRPAVPRPVAGPRVRRRRSR